MKKKNQTKIFLPLVSNLISLSLAVRILSISNKFSLFAFFHDIEAVLLCVFNVLKLFILRD